MKLNEMKYAKFQQDSSVRNRMANFYKSLRYFSAVTRDASSLTPY